VHGEVEEPVHAEQRQHVIEKRYSSVHIDATASIQIDADRDGGLIRPAFKLGSPVHRDSHPPVAPAARLNPLAFTPPAKKNWGGSVWNRPNAILFWRLHGIHTGMCRQLRCSIFHSVVLWNFHARNVAST